MYLLSQILPKEQAYIEPVRLMLINKGIKNVDLIKLPHLLNFSLETQNIQKREQKSLHDCVKVLLAFAKKLQEMSSSKHSKARTGSFACYIFLGHQSMVCTTTLNSIKLRLVNG